MQWGFSPCAESPICAHNRLSCPSRASDHNSSSCESCSGSSISSASNVMSLCSGYSQANSVVGTDTLMHIARTTSRVVVQPPPRGEKSVPFVAGGLTLRGEYISVPRDLKSCSDGPVGEPFSLLTTWPSWPLSNLDTQRSLAAAGV